MLHTTMVIMYIHKSQHFGNMRKHLRTYTLRRVHLQKCKDAEFICYSSTKTQMTSLENNNPCMRNIILWKRWFSIAVSSIEKKSDKLGEVIFIQGFFFFPGAFYFDIFQVTCWQFPSKPSYLHWFYWVPWSSHHDQTDFRKSSMMCLKCSM